MECSGPAQFFTYSAIATVYTWLVLFINFRLGKNRDSEAYTILAWISLVPALNAIIGIIGSICLIISALKLFFGIIFKS